MENQTINPTENKEQTQPVIFTKKCNKCGNEKSVDTENFRRQSASKDGFKNVCKICDDLYQKNRYEKQKPEFILKVKEWQKDHPKQLKKYRKRYIKNKKIKSGPELEKTS